MQTITREQIQEQLTAGANLTIIDARSAEKFAEGHLPGAINIPKDKVNELAPTLLTDKEQTIVTYCSSTACTASSSAAEDLSALGFTNVAAYLGGKDDWKSAGLKLSGASCDSEAGTCATTKTGTCG